MQQLQFFLLGLLVVWMVGTGKAVALWQAFTGPVSSSGGAPQGPGTSPYGNTPPSQQPSAGSQYTDPSGAIDPNKVVPGI